ncbi:MAG: alpha/beta hydrolase [Planctomycetota bacterium]|nr:alpha/beta hydrolase [Planctomycetota bacterium]
MLLRCLLFFFVLAVPRCSLVVGQTASRAGNQKTKRFDVPDGIERLPDLEYSRPDGISLKLDLYRPTATKQPTAAQNRLPVVVFVHGGGWKNGGKESVKKRLWLVPNGFAIASINYRLTNVGKWPDQINDCYAAVRWLRRNAERYNLAADKIGCWGSSAGGHLAALMGTRPCPDYEVTSSRVQAVCDWFGPTALLTMPPNNVGNGRTEADVANSTGAKLLGATVREVPKLARDASAIDHASSDDPPFLIMHGDADPGVPLSQSQTFHQRLSDTGVTSTLIILEGAGHGGSEFDANTSQDAVINFFRQHLSN